MPEGGERDESQESGDDEFAIPLDEEFVRSATVREPNWKERQREAKRIQRQHRKEQRQFKRRRRANRLGGLGGVGGRFGGWSDYKGLLILVALVVAGFIFAGLEGRGPFGFLRSEPSRTPPTVSTTTVPAEPPGEQTPTTPDGPEGRGGTSAPPSGASTGPG